MSHSQILDQMAAILLFYFPSASGIFFYTVQLRRQTSLDMDFHKDIVESLLLMGSGLRDSSFQDRMPE